MNTYSFRGFVFLTFAITITQSTTWACKGEFQEYSGDARCHIDLAVGLVRANAAGTFFNTRTCTFDSMMFASHSQRQKWTQECQNVLSGHSVSVSGSSHETFSHSNPHTNPTTTKDPNNPCSSSGQYLLDSLDNCSTTLSVFSHLNAIREDFDCLVHVVKTLEGRHRHQRYSGCRCSDSTYQLHFRHTQGDYYSCYHLDAYRVLLESLMSYTPNRYGDYRLYCRSHYWVWGHLYSIGTQNHHCMKDLIEHTYVAIADQHPKCHCHSDHTVATTTASTTTTTTAMPTTETPTTTSPKTTTTTSSITTKSATTTVTPTKPKPTTPAATTTKPKPITPVTTKTTKASTVTPSMTTPVIIQPTTNQGDKLFCRDCADYFTSACNTSTFEACTGSCMMIQKSGKLEMKCVKTAVCQLQQISDLLTPDSHTDCCTDTTCMMSTLQTAVQNHAQVSTVATTTQKYIWVSVPNH